MKKAIIILGLVLIIAAASSLNAQWAKAYGGKSDDWANAIVPAPGGGFIVVGATRSDMKNPSWLKSYWILKLKNDGTVLWQKREPSLCESEASDVLVTRDAKVAVLVFQSNASLTTPYGWSRILKMDGGGNENYDFNVAYHSNYKDVAGAFCQVGDGGYHVVGTMSNWPGSTPWQGLMAYRYNKYGGPRTFICADGPKEDTGNALAATSDGGSIVVGRTKSFGAGGSDIWLLKLTSGCEIQWQYTYGDAGEDSAFDVRQTSDGGFVILGQTDSFGAGQGDIWVLKLDKDGKPEWQRTYGGRKADYAHAILQTRDGGYVVGGTTYSFGSGKADAWVFKLDAKGAIAWQMCYGGKDYDGVWSIQELSGAAGGYIAAGRTRSFGAGGDDALVLKLKSDGSIDPSCGSFLRPSEASVGRSTIRGLSTQVEAPGKGNPMLEVNLKAAENYARTGRTVICKK